MSGTFAFIADHAAIARLETANLATDEAHGRFLRHRLASIARRRAIMTVNTVVTLRERIVKVCWYVNIELCQTGFASTNHQDLL